MTEDDDYTKGWKARGVYIRERREAYRGTSIGFAMTLAFGMFFASFLVMGVWLSVLDQLYWHLLISGLLSALGWWVGRRENRSYAARIKAFNERWGIKK